MTYSPMLERTVPSARISLTSLFGMGRGVTLSQLLPAIIIFLPEAKNIYRPERRSVFLLRKGKKLFERTIVTYL